MQRSYMQLTASENWLDYSSSGRGMNRQCRGWGFEPPSNHLIFGCLRNSF